jgi:hypothetical protein
MTGARLLAGTLHQVTAGPAAGRQPRSSLLRQRWRVDRALRSAVVSRHHLVFARTPTEETRSRARRVDRERSQQMRRYLGNRNRVVELHCQSGPESSAAPRPLSGAAAVRHHLSQGLRAVVSPTGIRGGGRGQPWFLLRFSLGVVWFPTRGSPTRPGGTNPRHLGDFASTPADVAGQEILGVVGFLICAS